MPGEAAKDLDVEGYVDPGRRRVKLRYRSPGTVDWVGVTDDWSPVAEGGPAGQDALAAAMAGDARAWASRAARPSALLAPCRAAVDPRLLRLRGARGDGAPEPGPRDGARLVRAAGLLLHQPGGGPRPRRRGVGSRRRTAELDYELEVAAVIGRGVPRRAGRRRRWLDVVAGFTVMTTGRRATCNAARCGWVSARPRARTSPPSLGPDPRHPRGAARRRGGPAVGDDGRPGQRRGVEPGRARRPPLLLGRADRPRVARHRAACPAT